MTATPALTTDLKAQVKLLADDLRKRLEADSELLAGWQRIHREAVTRDRTAMTWVDWREDRIDQAAVAWVLTTVFIRFCEDNSLVKPVWISGPKERRQEAMGARNDFFRSSPKHGEYTDREWLETPIGYLRKLPATKPLVDDHSALEYVSPSGDAVTKLLDFWRRRGDDGVLVHDLYDESLSTRFLGDLYQDLSDYAKDKYALLQTPVFVEEHILDRTLKPALNDRPLDGFRMIDPTCGSGHFLLGAFDRLLDRWHKHAPGMEIQAKVQTALNAIHGVDLNPFAVAIARFRLTVAALKACGLRSLEDAPAFKFHLATGDSLIHGPDENVIPGLEDRSAFMPFHYSTEDGPLLLEMLSEGRYDAVVGNPPYITPKDKALNKIYRSKFGKLCKGTYALTVPFMVEFFALAKRGEQSGWIGIITSNSFMKREFGVPLIENFLAYRDLLIVADTAVAHIPGHGTPTVVLVGRNRPPESATVKAVLGKRREVPNPEIPSEGKVWLSLVEHLDSVDWDDEWITIANLDRKLLSIHPWALSGGGAGQVQKLIESAGDKLRNRVMRIGFMAMSHADQAFTLPSPCVWRAKLSDKLWPLLVSGDDVRDYVASAASRTYFPYGRLATLKNLPEGSREWKWLWPLRTDLYHRATFGGGTYLSERRPWYEWHQVPKDSGTSALSVAFAFVATHNHFILDRGGKVFKQSAPVIKLPDGATENDHLALIGILNSSAACFWLKQASYDKGAGGIAEGIKSEAWERFYEFTGTTLLDYPLPKKMSLRHAQELEILAQISAEHEPAKISADEMPTRVALNVARGESRNIRARMMATQEELDWEVYRLYGLIDEDLTYNGDDLPGLALGERSFEIALARSHEPTAWFERHASTPMTEIPAHWPVAYRELVQRRLDLITEHPYIRLLEKPEYKRRWAQEPWEKRQERAVRDWLLDHLEDRRFWFDALGRPSPRSISQLGDDVTREAETASVLALWEGRPDVPVADSLTRLLADEAVPFHSGHRYKASGLDKRKAWEETWSLQRREDAGEKVEIQVPPKYTSADFAKASYWKHRGKLDVPKERFIFYPDASRDGDGTPLLGWAGWDHAEQALALASIIHDREQEGWPDKDLVPLIAGLAELQPWVDQWHGDVHPVYGVPLAAFCAEELARRAAQVSMTIEQLRWWRPEKKAKGRGKG